MGEHLGYISNLSEAYQWHILGIYGTYFGNIEISTKLIEKLAAAFYGLSSLFWRGEAASLEPKGARSWLKEVRMSHT